MNPAKKRFITLTAVISFFMLVTLIPLNAGFFNVLGSEDIIIIKLEDCCKCGGCTDSCPDSFIMLENGPAILVGYDMDEVRYCADICPTDAIQINP